MSRGLGEKREQKAICISTFPGVPAFLSIKGPAGAPRGCRDKRPARRPGPGRPADAGVRLPAGGSDLAGPISEVLM